MVVTKSPNHVDPTYLRKIRKPMVEKRRRDRMNNSLEQLKSLLAVNIKQTDYLSALCKHLGAAILQHQRHINLSLPLMQSSSPMSRLDKADILELTVVHLTTLEHQQRSVTMATEASGYKKGFKDCARETITYLSSTRSIDTDTLFQLNNHLQSSYLQKTRQAQTASYPTEVIPAHVSSQPDSSPASDITLYQAQNSSCIPVSESGRGVSLTPGAYHRYDQFQACFNPCNSSVDTSFNSSCNMSLDSSALATPEKLLPVQVVNVSLDSSSVVTPEKLLPGQYTDMSLDSSSLETPEKEDVWRPW